jgi:uncharacterized protein (DUF4415 family)
MPEWIDPDDAPPLGPDFFRRGEARVAGKVVRPADGTLTRLERPPAGDAPKRQVTLRLDPDVIERFRADGPGW